MVAPQVGPTTFHPSVPYMTTEYFRHRPTGLALDMLSPGINDQRLQDAELADIILEASADMDAFCYGASGGVLRATTDTEVLMMRLDRFGTFRLTPRFTPVIALTALSYGPDATLMTALTDLSAAHVEPIKINVPAFPFTGNSSAGPLQFGPIVTTARDMRVQFSYINGFPLTSLTGGISVGATSFTVQDPTAIYVGTQLMLRDQENGTEPVVVTGVAGSVMSCAPTAYAHPAGTFADGLPQPILDACVEITIGKLKRRAGTAIKPQGMGRGKAAAEPVGPGEDNFQEGFGKLMPYVQQRSR
jgi:hypothetical protein